MFTATRVRRLVLARRWSTTNWVIGLLIYAVGGLFLGTLVWLATQSMPLLFCLRAEANLYPVLIAVAALYPTVAEQLNIFIGTNQFALERALGCVELAIVQWN